MKVPVPGSVLPAPITLPPLKFIESPNQSGRDRAVNCVVVHDTEGGYEGACSWFTRASSQVSAHIVLKEDGSEATQMVPYSRKAWHCMTFNSQTIGLEMAGFARLGYRDAQLRRAARIVAFFLHKYGLPPNHVKPDDLGRLPRGWTMHQDLGQLGGGHSDPGFSKWKAFWFARLVAAEYRRGGFREHWGRS